MKFQKVIFILSVSVLFFSCASKPKNQEPVQPVTENEEISAVEENQVAPVEETEKAPEVENTIPEVLEEKLTDEDEPVIPSLPEELSPQYVEKIDYSEQTEQTVPEVPVVEEKKSEPEVKKSDFEEKFATKEEVQEELKKVEESIDSLKKNQEELLNQDKNSENKISFENKPDTNQMPSVPVKESENNISEKTPETEENSNNNAEQQADEEKSDENLEQQLEEAKQIVPSRSVTLMKNQYLDIVYPGSGWIYLGQVDQQKDFIFYGRKLGGKDTSFTLRSKNPGTFILHFYKNDSLTGNYIDDYLEVKVQDKNANSNDHIKAASYAEVVPPKAEITADKIKEDKKRQALAQEAKRTAEKEESIKKPVPSSKETDKKTAVTEDNDSKGMTVIKSSDSKNENESEKITFNKKDSDSKEVKTPETEKKDNESDNSLSLKNLSSDELLVKAKELFNSKDYAGAKKVLEKFFENTTKNIDEGLYLQGQILEAKSPQQNIKGAVESYDLLVKNHPTSKFWSQAAKRSKYLKFFYNIK